MSQRHQRGEDGGNPDRADQGPEGWIRQMDSLAAHSGWFGQRPTPLTFRFPQGVPSMDDRELREVPLLRRRRYGPLEGGPIPGVGWSVWRPAPGPQDIDEKDQEGSRENKGPYRLDAIQRLEAQAGWVGVRPPRHSVQTHEVHGKEGHVEADQHEP